MAKIKTSPLCSRSEGREIYFTARIDDRKYKFTATEQMLDDICGNAATEPSRKAWVKDNTPAILDARLPNGSSAPYDRVRIEEIA